MMELRILLCVITVVNIVGSNVHLYVPCQYVQRSHSNETQLPNGSIQVQNMHKRSKRETPEDWQQRLEQLKQCLNAFSSLCSAITQASLDIASVSPTVAGALSDLRTRIWNLYLQVLFDLEILRRSVPPNSQPPRRISDTARHTYLAMAYDFFYFFSAYEYLRHTDVQTLPPSQARFPFFSAGVEISLQDTNDDTSGSSAQWFDDRMFETATSIGEFDRDHVVSELDQIARRIRSYLSIFADTLESSAVVFSEIQNEERRRANDDLVRRLLEARGDISEYLRYLQTNPRDSLDRLRRISENSRQTLHDINVYLTEVLQMSANYVGTRFELDNELLYGDMSAPGERQVTDGRIAAQRLRMRYNALEERRTQIQGVQSSLAPQLAQLLPEQTPIMNWISDRVANAHQQIESFEHESNLRIGVFQVDLYMEFLNILTYMNRIMVDLNRLGEAYNGISNACNFVPSTE